MECKKLQFICLEESDPRFENLIIMVISAGICLIIVTMCIFCCWCFVSHRARMEQNRIFEAVERGEELMMQG
jgi:heme/copper-type cytochrome/quinol oxidase subunit 2